MTHCAATTVFHSRDPMRLDDGSIVRELTLGCEGEHEGPVHHCTLPKATGAPYAGKRYEWQLPESTPSARAEGLYWVRHLGIAALDEYPLAQWDGERWWPIVDEGWLPAESFVELGPAIPPLGPLARDKEQGSEATKDVMQLLRWLAGNADDVDAWKERWTDFVRLAGAVLARAPYRPFVPPTGQAVPICTCGTELLCTRHPTGTGPGPA